MMKLLVVGLNYSPPKEQVQENCAKLISNPKHLLNFFSTAKNCKLKSFSFFAKFGLTADHQSLITPPQFPLWACESLPSVKTIVFVQLIDIPIISIVRPLFHRSTFPWRRTRTCALLSCSHRLPSMPVTAQQDLLPHIKCLCRYQGMYIGSTAGPGTL